MAQLLAAPSKWPISHRKTNCILHADHNLKEISDETLRQWFGLMSAQSLSFELEVGAVKPWSREGARTFAIETPAWRRAISLGAPLISVAMDEPRTAGRQLGMIDQDTIFQVADFVSLVRSQFPQLLVGDIETFPEFSVSESKKWRTELNRELQRRNSRPVDFFRLDADWNSFPHGRGSWTDVAQIAAQCRREGTPFSLIFWASKEPGEKRHGEANSSTWSNEVITEALACREAGISPDQIVIESWIGEPKMALPEGDPSSFAGSVLAVLDLELSSNSVRRLVNDSISVA